MSEALELHILSLVTQLVILASLLIGQRNAKRRIHRVEKDVKDLDGYVRTPTPTPFDDFANAPPETTNPNLRPQRISETTNPHIKSPYKPEGK